MKRLKVCVEKLGLELKTKPTALLIKDRELEDQNPIFIFDLDQTTINSEHRVGHGSLTSWVRNSTRENIMNDELMFLSQFIGILNNVGFQVIVCTSRVLGKDDWEFLYAKMYLPSDVKVIHRHEGDTREPNLYKKERLSYLANFKQYSKKIKILIDDNSEVRKSFRELGRNCKAWDIPYAEREFKMLFGV